VDQAGARVKKLLSEHQVEALPASTEAELERIVREVEQRESEGQE